VPQPLDVERMRAASSALLGRHDFAAFQASGSDLVTTVREVMASRVVESIQDAAGPSALWPLNLPPLVSGRLVGYEITGTGFLRHMVRNVVGTLSIVAPAYRLAPERIEKEVAPLVLKAGRELSSRLGFDTSTRREAQG